MDELSTLKARLAEMISAKVERLAALKAEQAAIEQELHESNAILSLWNRAAGGVILDAPPAIAPSTPEPPPVEDDYARRRRLYKEKRKAHVIKMRREAVIDYLSAVGPQDARRIMLHFGLTDGRGAAIFTVWTNTGHLVRHADGRFAAATPPISPATSESIDVAPVELQLGVV